MQGLKEWVFCVRWISVEGVFEFVGARFVCEIVSVWSRISRKRFLMGHKKFNF